ncbi:MgtC/SapB family protein, partial [Candidatus Gracilibacteria bacterium]|nr:MgtC/SapB family protein [Candidatus Gracilibacteria bacterium]
MEISFSVLAALGVALAIGVLIGLERESLRQHQNVSVLAGIRSFIFISLWGFLSSYISVIWVSWFFPVAFMALILLIGLAYFVRSTKGELSGGMTTEIACIITFLLAGLSLHMDNRIVLALGVLVALVLSVKIAFANILKRYPREAVIATIQFAVLTAVILPFLPNEYIGPWQFFNPYVAWWIVVLVTGMSYLGYILHLLISSRSSIFVTSAIGALVSSTAITNTLAQLSKSTRLPASLFVCGCIVASTIAALRVWFTASVINASLITLLAIPMGLIVITGLVFLWMWHSQTVTVEETAAFENPFQLKKAITFAFIFVLVAFFARSSIAMFGTSGLYLTSAIAGIADVDAMTITT